jgi:hypothetical protein
MECFLCGNKIEKDRADFLRENLMSPTCIPCATSYVSKSKLVDLGEDGVDTILCDAVALDVAFASED